MAHHEGVDDVAVKLEVIRTAMQHNFPAGDIATMLSEIGSIGEAAETNPAPGKIER